jgi:hypothetical protein
MQVNKWIELKAAIGPILDVIDDNLVDEGMVYEMAYKAMKMLQVHSTKVPRVKFVWIENYKGCLPKDLEEIQMVIHKEKISPKVCVDKLTDYFSSYGHKPGLLQATNLVDYFVADNWGVMMRATNKFSSTYFCGKDYNFNYTCKHDYNIVPGNMIVTSMKEGLVAVSYLGDPMLDGEFMIPDDEELMEAIKSYVLKTIWESRYNIKEEGADGRFQYYAAEWAMKKAKVKGKYKMPTLEEMEQIKWERLRLLPKVEHISTFFQFVTTPSAIDLMGKYFPSYPTQNSY